MIASALSSLSWKHATLGAIAGTIGSEIIYKRDDLKKAIKDPETETQKCASITGKVFITIAATLSMTYGNAGYGITLMTAGAFYYARHCPPRTVFELSQFDGKRYAKDYHPGFSHYQHHGVILITGILLCIGKCYWKGLNGSYTRPLTN